MKKRVTVLVAMRDSEEFIGQCLDSLCAQSEKSFDVVLVDDASSDRSVDIARTYDQKLSMKVIEMDLQVGQTKCLVEGAKHCSTEYICRLDADDFCSPFRIERQLKAMDLKPNIDIVACRANVIGKPARKNRFLIELSKTPNTIPLSNYICHSSVMIRKSAYERVGGYDVDMEFAQDYSLWLRLITTSNFYFMDERLVWRRLHSRRVGKQNAKQRYYYILLALQKEMQNSNSPARNIFFQVSLCYHYINFLVYVQFKHLLATLKRVSAGMLNKYSESDHSSSVLNAAEWFDFKLKSNVFRTTWGRRLSFTHHYIYSLVRDAYIAPSILDVGVSTGIVTNDLLQYLDGKGITCSIIGTDVLVNLEILRHRFMSVVRGDNMSEAYKLGPILLPSDLNKRILFTPLLLLWLLLTIYRNLIHILDIKPMASRHIPTTISPATSRNGSTVTFQRDDIFVNNRSLHGKFDIIRIANLLNPSYFSQDELHQALCNCKDYLKENGHLIVCRTDISSFSLRFISVFRLNKFKGKLEILASKGPRIYSRYLEELI